MIKNNQTVSVSQTLTQLVNSLSSPLQDDFIQRISEGQLTRGENPVSHFCCYFAAIDPLRKKVFIGHHIKSDLWLFNGGHMDKNETPDTTIAREMVEEWGFNPLESRAPAPQLLTISDIVDKVRPCKTHYDLWYFIQVDSAKFAPSPELLAVEFYENKWMTVPQALSLCTHPALLFLESNIFNNK